MSHVRVISRFGMPVLPASLLAALAGAAANQSLNRTDVIEGGSGNDVIFGLKRQRRDRRRPGSDIILGGPDGGAASTAPWIAARHPATDYLVRFRGPAGNIIVTVRVRGVEQSRTRQ